MGIPHAQHGHQGLHHVLHGHQEPRHAQHGHLIALTYNKLTAQGDPLLRMTQMGLMGNETPCRWERV